MHTRHAQQPLDCQWTHIHNPCPPALGRNKTKAAQGEQTRSRLTKPKQERSQNEEIVSQLKEFEEW